MKVSEEKFSIILYRNLPTLSMCRRNAQWYCSSFSDRPAVPANIQIANYDYIKLTAIGHSLLLRT